MILVYQSGMLVQVSITQEQKQGVQPSSLQAKGQEIPQPVCNDHIELIGGNTVPSVPIMNGTGVKPKIPKVSPPHNVIQHSKQLISLLLLNSNMNREQLMQLLDDE